MTTSRMLPMEYKILVTFTQAQDSQAQVYEALHVTAREGNHGCSWHHALTCTMTFGSCRRDLVVVIAVSGVHRRDVRACDIGVGSHICLLDYHYYLAAELLHKYGV